MVNRAPTSDYSERWCPHTPAKAGILHLVRCNADALGSDVRPFISSLTPDEMQRAAAFRFDHLRRRFIVARWCTRKILADLLGIHPVEISFRYGLNGKPFLAGPESCLQFNVSHSEGEVMVGVTVEVSVGVDVEAIRPDFPHEEIVSEYFSKRELSEYRALPASERICAFYAGWTRKEAFIKATGEGVSYGLDNFDVALNCQEAATLLRTRDDDSDAWTLASTGWQPGYAAAYAVRCKELQVCKWEMR